MAMTADVVLSPQLLAAAGTFEGGRLCLIIGQDAQGPHRLAFRSRERWPWRRTGRLVADGILAGGDVGNPEDLTAVADAVFLAQGSQEALVERMDPERLRMSEPNEGYLLAAALRSSKELSGQSSLLTSTWQLQARWFGWGRVTSNYPQGSGGLRKARVPEPHLSASKRRVTGRGVGAANCPNCGRWMAWPVAGTPGQASSVGTRDRICWPRFASRSAH